MTIMNSTMHRHASPLCMLLPLFMLTLTATRASAAVKVVATISDLAALAREVGGDLVTVESLSQPHHDPHRVNATPSMVVRLSQADLFVMNGLELEIGWAPALLQASRSSKIRPGGPGYVDASVRVPLLEIPSGAIDRSMGDVHPFGNPHYTLDPGRCKWAAWNITNGLVRVDPGHADQYKARLKTFYARIDNLLASVGEKMRPHRGARVIVYHKRFEYLLDRLGLMEVASIEPKPGIPPSAAHIAHLIAAYKDQGIRAIIIEPWNDRRIAEQIASAIGAKIVVSVGAVGSDPKAANVMELFERNTELILAALSGNR